MVTSWHPTLHLIVVGELLLVELTWLSHGARDTGVERRGRVNLARLGIHVLVLTSSSLHSAIGVILHLASVSLHLIRPHVVWHLVAHLRLPSIAVIVILHLVLWEFGGLLHVGSLLLLSIHVNVWALIILLLLHMVPLHVTVVPAHSIPPLVAHVLPPSRLHLLLLHVRVRIRHLLLLELVLLVIEIDIDPASNVSSLLATHHILWCHLGVEGVR